jgi:hypothetical protein
MLNLHCSYCDYSTLSKGSFKKHCASKKHEVNTKLTEKIVTKFQCKNCDKYYKGQSGLWGHKRVCTIIKEKFEEPSKTITLSNVASKEDIEELKRANKEDIDELKNMIINHQNAQQPTIINNDNTVNNFNINLFLRDKCDKAINMDDFMKNISYEFADFNQMIEDYVEGSMSILKKNWNQIPLHRRPMHYLEGEDKNQQVFHIRQNDIWKTETEINWMKQVNADFEDNLEKQTLYFILKQLDHDKLQYLRYKYSANHDYIKHHKRLNCEITRIDKKMLLYDEIIKMITLNPEEFNCK